MGKDIKTYGAFKPMTEDGITAYAENIYDADREEMQSDINAKVGTPQAPLYFKTVGGVKYLILKCTERVIAEMKRIVNPTILDTPSTSFDGWTSEQESSIPTVALLQKFFYNKNQIDAAPVKFLGNFSTSGAGETAAAEATYAGDAKVKLMWYTVTGGKVGIIHNYPSSAYCTQILYLDTKSFARVLNFTDANRTTVSVVGSWNERKELSKSEWTSLVDRVTALENR